MIRLNQMVTLAIGDCDWIGQVVEMRDEVCLIRLFDNMHYHAHVSELTPFSGSKS